MVELIKNYYSYKVFDGSEIDYSKTVINEYEAEFPNEEFHDIENLMSIVGEKNFQKVISELEIAKANEYFPNSYSGSDELPLKYIINGDLLLVVSSGEFQPMRFKIYLEGIWKIQSHTDNF